MNIIKYLELTVHPRVVEYFMDELGEYQCLVGVEHPKKVYACVKLYNLMSQTRDVKFDMSKIHASLGLYLHKQNVEIKYILEAIKQSIKVDVKRCSTDPNIDEREMTMILIGMDKLHQLFSNENNEMKVLLN